jgi:hypothetical protein
MRSPPHIAVRPRRLRSAMHACPVGQPQATALYSVRTVSTSASIRVPPIRPNRLSRSPAS